jgi:hypothetical protein
LSFLDNRNSEFGRASSVSALTANCSAGDDAIGNDGEDDGTDDDAMCEPEAGGAVVATCEFAEGSVA